MTGLKTPPCRVPATVGRTRPSCITPARNIARSSFSTGWSQTRSSTACIDLPCGIAVKQLAMSVPGHPPAAPRALVDEHLQGIVRRPPRAEPEAARQEISLEDRPRARSSPRPARSGREPQEWTAASARPQARPAWGYRPCARAAGGSGPPSARGQLAGQPVYAVLPDPGQGDLAGARRAVVPAHRDPRAPQHVAAADLVNSAWNRRPGSALAARSSACRKARTGSPATGDPCAAGLALTALTGPLQTTLRTDEAAALPSPQVVLSRRSNRYYGRLRRPPGQPSASRSRRLQDAALR